MLKTIRVLLFILLLIFISGCQEEKASNDQGKDRSFLKASDIIVRGDNQYKKIEENKKELQELLVQIKTQLRDDEKRDLYFEVGEKYVFLGNLQEAKKNFDLSYKYNPGHDHTTAISFYCFLVESELGNLQLANKYLKEMQGQTLGSYWDFKWAKDSGFFPKTIKTKKFQDAIDMAFRYCRDTGLFNKNEMSPELWEKYK
jgi:tetratricopeptide (TPR) repeat protein